MMKMSKGLVLSVLLVFMVVLFGGCSNVLKVIMPYSPPKENLSIFDGIEVEDTDKSWGASYEERKADLDKDFASKANFTVRDYDDFVRISMGFKILDEIADDSVYTRNIEEYNFQKSRNELRILDVSDYDAPLTVRNLSLMTALFMNKFNFHIPEMQELTLTDKEVEKLTFDGDYNRREAKILEMAKPVVEKLGKQDYYEVLTVDEVRVWMEYFDVNAKTDKLVLRDFKLNGYTDEYVSYELQK